MRSLIRLASLPPNHWLDLALPRACISCGMGLQEQAVSMCASCASSLPGLLIARCHRCATSRLQYAANQPDSVCALCLRLQPPFAASFALCDYASPIDEMVLALKFQRRWSLGKALGTTLGQRRGSVILECALQLQNPHGSDTVKSSRQRYRNRPKIHLCAIPLGAPRLIERGFNQSQLILNGLREALEAHPLAANVEITNTNFLVRSRNTEAQTLVAPKLREHNLHNAFIARKDCRDQTVVLVDDVMTTGATLSSAASALRSAGAFAVINAVVARTDSFESESGIFRLAINANDPVVRRVS